MADFRRWIPVLAVVAIIIGTATTASAATALSCIAGGAVIPELRSEGITELTGDLVYNCVGGTPTDLGAPVPRVNIQVFMNSPLAITSRLIGSGDEALLMIDDPAEADQTLCLQPVTGCNLTGVGAGPAQQTAYKGGRFSVFQGVPSALNSVLFTGVPVDPPGTALDTSGQPLNRVIRITNIRVNASAFHGATGATNLTALTSASPSSTLPINQQGIQTIGIILPGLVVTYSNKPQPGGFSFQQCFASSSVVDGDTVTFVDGADVTFTEGFGTSFKTRTIGDGTLDSPATVVVAQDNPGQFFNTETGFYNPNFGNGLGAAPGGAGLADYGTRLKVVFTNIPANVNITAPAVVTNGTLTIKGTSSESGPYSPVSAFSFTATSTANSFTWVWEVTRADISQENATIPFQASWTGPGGTHPPALGTAQVSGWFAPTSTDMVAETEADAKIPRFQDFSANPDAFTIQKCQTHLLFPFVTNQLGFDTGIAISNTSTDQYGTTPQSGPCHLYFYGVNAPAVFDTPSDVTSAGGPFASTVLTLAPNFQGYIIADCDFQYAHGFAFVTKVGTTDVAMGYLALIIPDSPFGGNRIPQAFPAKPGNSGEQLGY